MGKISNTPALQISIIPSSYGIKPITLCALRYAQFIRKYRLIIAFMAYL